jgi:hypothetical protein
VTEMCVLMYCSSLTTLRDLKNIPKVEIHSCGAACDFSGLGNHESLLFRNCPILSKFVDEYLNEQRHKEIFSTIRHMYYSADCENTQQIW